MLHVFDGDAPVTGFTLSVIRPGAPLAEVEEQTEPGIYAEEDVRPGSYGALVATTGLSASVTFQVVAGSVIHVDVPLKPLPTAKSPVVVFRVAAPPWPTEPVRHLSDAIDSPGLHLVRVFLEALPREGSIRACDMTVAADPPLCDVSSRLARIEGMTLDDVKRLFPGQWHSTSVSGETSIYVDGAILFGAVDMP